MIDIERSLKRIGYTGPIQTTLDTLRDLQIAFLLNVPFENLDIHLGRPIGLASESITTKIVSKNRGGFCYECNILFFELLRAFGFQVDYLSAKMVKGGAAGPEYDHMVLLVHLEHDYLVDVGNGQSCREPLRIDGANRANSEGYVYRIGTYRIGTYVKEYALYYRQPGTAWTPRYLFTLPPRDWTDFKNMCQYHQTSPDSVFTQQRLVTLATLEGRITLTDMQLSISRGVEKQESVIKSEDEYYEILKQEFGIDIASELIKNPVECYNDENGTKDRRGPRAARRS